MKRYSFAPLVLMISLSAAASSPAPELSGPVDRIQQDVLKIRKSKGARAISGAYRDLQEKRWDEALKKARSARGHLDYADYSYWIEATVHFRRAELELERKKPVEALKLVERAITSYLEVLRQSPYSSLLKKIPEEVAAAELLGAEAEVARNRVRSANVFYERAFQRLSDVRALGQLRPDTLKRYAENCAKAASSLCRPWLQRFSGYFPKASAEAKAVAQHYPEQDRPRAPRYDRATQSYRSPDRDIQAFDLAFEKFRAREFGDAVKAFRQVLEEFPRSSHRWRAGFWLAKALKADGENEEAQYRFERLLVDSPLSYYGMLAALEIGKDPESLISAALPSATAIDPLLQPDEAFSLRRAEEFLAEKNAELAAYELRDFRARAQHSSQFLMYLAVLQNRVRNHIVSFSIISELIQRGHEGVATSYVLRMIFPVEYMDLIRRYSTENGLDPVLVLSLVKQESAFDRRAVSSAGASGLMQLMPATAVDTISGVLRSELSDEEANIRVGTKYLGQLMRRFNGNIVLSLAGYNAGPGAVERWRKEPPLKPGMLEFIEAIPYRETREYVGSIIRNYYWYSRRIEDATPKAIDYFWQVAGPPEPKLISQ